MQQFKSVRDDAIVGARPEGLFVLTRTRDGRSTEALRVYSDLQRALSVALDLSVRDDGRDVFRIVRGDRRTLLLVARGRVHPVDVSR